jgi:hypothetical protein
MYSRKIVYTIGRWRLSVYNTTSILDIEQNYIHYTRYSTKALVALSIVMSPELVSLR